MGKGEKTDVPPATRETVQRPSIPEGSLTALSRALQTESIAFSVTEKQLDFLKGSNHRKTTVSGYGVSSDDDSLRSGGGLLVVNQTLILIVDDVNQDLRWLFIDVVDKGRKREMSSIGRKRDKNCIITLNEIEHFRIILVILEIILWIAGSFDTPTLAADATPDHFVKHISHRSPPEGRKTFQAEEISRIVSIDSVAGAVDTLGWYDLNMSCSKISMLSSLLDGQ